MEIIQRFITKNPSYYANQVQQDYRYTDFQKYGAKGAVLHSIGVQQPSAQLIANNFDKGTAEASVHAVLQADGLVVQTMPWNYRAWHVGGSANNTHIGVEMTEPDCIWYDAKNGYKVHINDYAKATAFVKATYGVAVELFAQLCAENGWNPLEDGVILSHKECHARGLGSNHGDPEHLWDALNTGYTMDKFRADVAEKMEEENMVRYQKVDEMPAWAQPEIQELVDANALRGDENGNLNLTEDMIRMLIINKRYAESVGCCRGK